MLIKTSGQFSPNYSVINVVQFFQLLSSFDFRNEHQSASREMETVCLFSSFATSAFGRGGMEAGIRRGKLKGNLICDLQKIQQSRR